MALENVSLLVYIGYRPRNFEHAVIPSCREAEHFGGLVKESSRRGLYPGAGVDPPTGRMCIARDPTHSSESLRLSFARPCNTMPDRGSRLAQPAGAQIRQWNRAGRDMHVDPVGKRT